MGVTGRQAALAFGIYGANSWGVATSVTRRAYFESDAGLTTQPTYVDDQSFGQTFMGPADVGDFQPATLNWTGQHYYDHWDHWFEACAMGSPAAPTVVSSQAASSLVAYQHIIDLSAVTTGRGVTLAADKELYVEELTSAKVTGFSIGYGTGGVLTKGFSFLGAKSTNSSTINTRSAVVASVATAPALANRIYRSQGQIRMNLQSAAGLGGSDVVADVENITFRFDRPHDTAMVTGANYTSEPRDNGWPSGVLTFNFRQATTTTANSFYALAQAGTALKCDIIFTGNYINSTTQRQFKLEMPHLEPQGPMTFEVSGATQAKPTMRFACKNAAAAPTGMTVTNPFRLTRISPNSVSAF